MKGGSFSGVILIVSWMAMSIIIVEYLSIINLFMQFLLPINQVIISIHIHYPYFISGFYLLSSFLYYIDKPSRHRLESTIWNLKTFFQISLVLLFMLEILVVYQLPIWLVGVIHPICIIGYKLFLGSIFGFGLISRSIHTESEIKASHELENIKIKTATRKIENEVSFHWKTNKGYINILNPFQGIFIVGGAGSGKTYSIIQEIIIQAIQKDYTGFIYDYKYPELSEVIFEELQRKKSNRIMFYSVNFSDLSKSHRLNPIHPRNLPISLFAHEYAATILKNLKKEWVHKQDFWADNAIAYFKAIIWYLKKHAPQYCTLPHAIAIALKEYPEVLEMLSRDRECQGMISSLWTAYKENASAQLAGCVSSLQNPLDRLNNPNLFWILSGDEISLDLNDPLNPAILTIGNQASLSESLNPIISLVASVVMKNLNQRGKLKSIFLLDEAPTLYLPNLKDLPNTGRSNMVATIYCCQDYSQMDLMYGHEEAKVIRASLGNQFLGMVNDLETANQISKVFGKEDRIIQSQNHGSSFSASQEINYNSGYSYHHQEREVLKPNAALYFTPGFFVGKVTSSKNPFFSGSFIISQRTDQKKIPEFNNALGYLKENSSSLIQWNYERIFQEAQEIIYQKTIP